jgi:hypothetical protein
MMKLVSARRGLNRIHIWLGWVIFVPLVIWTITGLWMVARPIEEVRGVHLKADAPALGIDGPVTLPKFPEDHGPPTAVRLEQQDSGPVWIATFAHGHEMRARAKDGIWLPSVSENEARAIAQRWYKPDAAILSATHTPADAPPLDLRRERPAWGISFADGANVYVDADTGSLLAIRSQQWRAFDFMWGLHIMDLESREDTHHPLLIGAAFVSALAVILATMLLFVRRRRKKGATPRS